MIVKVRFRGPIAARMSSDIYEIKADNNATLNDVLINLIREHEEVRDVWTSSEQMDRDTLLLRNDADIGLFDGLETKLDDGDELIILPLVHGG
ncbi:MAG: MoaD/ThiS family protein [Candidatus Thorarchaeota archaeon]|nr:MoaD/ThiS family protein [Candidatus Thorarchaeota archaeon]